MNEAPEMPGRRKKHQIYRCFLLRCRLVVGAAGTDDSSPRWRFTVQEAGDGGTGHTFASLSDVEAYLETELGLPGEDRLR